MVLPERHYLSVLVEYGRRLLGRGVSILPSHETRTLTIQASGEKSVGHLCILFDSQKSMALLSHYMITVSPFPFLSTKTWISVPLIFGCL